MKIIEYLIFHQSYHRLRITHLGLWISNNLDSRGRFLNLQYSQSKCNTENHHVESNWNRDYNECQLYQVHNGNRSQRSRMFRLLIGHNCLQGIFHRLNQLKIKFFNSTRMTNEKFNSYIYQFL